MNATEYRWAAPGLGAPLLKEERYLIIPVNEELSEVWYGLGYASGRVFTTTHEGALHYVSNRGIALEEKGYHQIVNGNQEAGQ